MAQVLATGSRVQGELEQGSYGQQQRSDEQGKNANAPDGSKLQFFGTPEAVPAAKQELCKHGRHRQEETLGFRELQKTRLKPKQPGQEV